MFLVETPTRLRIFDHNQDLDILQSALRYHDLSVEHQIYLFKKNKWYKSKYGEDRFAEYLSKLKEQRLKSRLFQDEKGYYTDSGFLDYLPNLLQDFGIKYGYKYPEYDGIPWAKEPEHKLRYYQRESVEKLLYVKHGAVELATGLGKSFCVMYILREIGLKSIIMVPSRSIARQMYDDFCKYLGKKYVGLYGDGKKEYKKLFVIGIAASLNLVDEGSEIFEELSKAQVFCSDESHLTPANTLADVCMGLVKNAPYRFFFSATQMRNDGADLFLHGITGPIVNVMTAEQGIREGFLARPHFYMVNVRNNIYIPPTSGDTNELTRKYLYYDNKVNEIAGEIINKAIELKKSQVLVLIDEIEQFSKLLPHIKYPVGFAHGQLTKTNKAQVPEQYLKEGPNELVKRFDKKEIPVLIGTSAIGIGTNILSANVLVYLRGGKSEIEVRQGIGRSLRIFGDKKDVNIFDFDIPNVPQLHRHALVRRAIYESIFPNSIQEL